MTGDRIKVAMDSKVVTLENNFTTMNGDLNATTTKANTNESDIADLESGVNAIGDYGSEYKTDLELSADTYKNLVTKTVSPGTWIISGGIAINQSGTEDVSNYIAAMITSNATSPSTEAGILSTAYATMIRMCGGADGGGALVPRIVTPTTTTTYYLRAISDFTTANNSVKAYLSAIRISL